MKKRSFFRAHFGKTTIVAIALGFTLAAPVAATLPAVDEIYVDIDGVARIAADHFPAPVVEEARRRLVRVTQARPRLRAPYGEAFVPLGPPMHLRDALQVFWSDSCGKGQCDRLRRLFARLSDETRVRGMLSAPSYSGCAEARLDFAPGNLVFIALHARQFTGCPIATRDRLVGRYHLGMR